MAKWAFILLVTLIAATALYFGLRKKPEPVAVEPAVEEPAVPAGPHPGIEFHDPEKQRRYEALFYAALERFAQPGPGEYVWVRLWDGRLAGGKIVAASPSGISLANEHEISDLRVTDLAMESREILFPTEFARGLAMREITGEAVLPEEIPPTSRLPLTDDLDARVGPGICYRRIHNVEFARGRPVIAIAEQTGWLLVSDRPGGPTCWVPKCMTISIDDASGETLHKDIESLKMLGILAGISPATNEADIDIAIWHGTDPTVRMGLARTLAAYCAFVRGNNLQFVTIRDRGTQRKLGKYTQSMGWRDSS